MMGTVAPRAARDATPRRHRGIIYKNNTTDFSASAAQEIISLNEKVKQLLSK
jgi:hypothetical protein